MIAQSSFVGAQHAAPFLATSAAVLDLEFFVRSAVWHRKYAKIKLAISREHQENREH
jgi:hypothetical protein